MDLPLISSNNQAHLRTRATRLNINMACTYVGQCTYSQHVDATRTAVIQ